MNHSRLLPLLVLFAMAGLLIFLIMASAPSADVSGLPHPSNAPGIFQPYYGDPNTGKACDPNKVPLCVDFYDAHGHDCNPLTNTLSFNSDPEHPVPYPFVGPCKPTYVPTLRQAQDQFTERQIGNPFVEGMALWFIDPAVAVNTIGTISNASSMELGFLAFIPVWLGAVSIPLVLIVIAVLIFFLWRKHDKRETAQM